MKKLLVILFLPLLSFGQSEGSPQNPELQDSIKTGMIYVQNGAVIFQKVYPSKLNKEQLLLALKSFLPTVKTFDFKNEFGQSNEQLNGKLNHYFVSRRNRNGGMFRNLTDSPLNADVTIQIKDYKYRVTISEIIFLGDTTKSTLDDEVLRANSPKFKDFENVTKNLSRDFDWEFDIARNNKVVSDF